MWYYYLATALVALWWFLLRPRGGGKGSPPLVTESKVFPMVPFVGVISEFLKSPNDMMARCLKDYGSVFTIPVRGSRGFCFVVARIYCGCLWRCTVLF